MSRRETAMVCATAVAALLMLWWAAVLPSGWVAWTVRIGAVLAVPAVFFGVLCVQLVRQNRREEAGLTPEQVQRRRRAASQRVLRDAAPLLSRPERIVRPLRRDRRPPP